MKIFNLIWNCAINFHSCIKHKISESLLTSIILDSNGTFDYGIDANSFDFVVKSGVKISLVFTITESISSNIKIMCHDSVDVTIRLIVLFPESVDLAMSIVICGTKSNVQVFGMYALTDKQLVKISTEQIHCGHSSNSKVVLHGILSGQARLHYDGMIRIEKNAFGTYALQNNKNILLSTTAAAISIPNIEVLNNDVQCYHGAAVGKFDMQQMQYMQSRGMSDFVIKRVLIQALFTDLFDGYDKKEFILQSMYEKI